MYPPPQCQVRDREQHVTREMESSMYPPPHMTCILLLNGEQHVTREMESSVCVFYYCRTYYKAVRVGGGGACHVICHAAAHARER